MGSFWQEFIGEAENRPGLASEYVLDVASGRFVENSSLMGDGGCCTAFIIRIGFRMAGGGGYDAGLDEVSRYWFEEGGDGVGGNCLDDKSFHERLKLIKIFL